MAEQQRKGTKEPKSKRLELRLAPAARTLIEQALALSGLSVVDVALHGARQIIEEHERVTLRGEDRDAFLQAVRNPPKPTAKLREAFRDHSLPR